MEKGEKEEGICGGWRTEEREKDTQVDWMDCSFTLIVALVVVPSLNITIPYSR